MKNIRELTIGTLNIWRYYDWEQRKKQLLEVIKREKLDIICLQEVQINPSFSAQSQAQQLAELLGYNHWIFSPTMRKQGQIHKDGGEQSDVTHGLAILSKLPIVNSEGIYLPQQLQDPEQRSILLASILIGEDIINICNVHFSNNDIFATKHLEKTVSILSDRKINPVIVGDYNLYDINTWSLPKNYDLSTDLVSYCSYPKDSGTLDYIASPKEYKMSGVRCLSEAISDHRLVIAKISIVPSPAT